VDVATNSGSATLTNIGAPTYDITVGDVSATNTINVTAGGSIYNDGTVGTYITAPTANLVATTGTIGIWGEPVEVDVHGTLYIKAGGIEPANGFLSANLQGKDVFALVTDLSIPGLVLFNDAQIGEPLMNGVPYYFNNLMTNKVFQAAAQNTTSLANEIEPYALTLDVYGDALFAPYPDLITFLEAGVTPDYDELRTQLIK